MLKSDDPDGYTREYGSEFSKGIMNVMHEVAVMGQDMRSLFKILAKVIKPKYDPTEEMIRRFFSNEVLFPILLKYANTSSSLNYS